MKEHKRPSLGLALSGSGNRSSFYIGFLEVLEEQGVAVDYIAASSGGALVASAYACGAIKEFKNFFSTLNNEKLKSLITPATGRGGMYSLDRVEEELRKFTKNKRFEDVRPLMGFITVDIESGEQVVLSMGDIARAARASCTLPGVFEPVKWGNRTLVDGGISSLIPTDVLEQAGVDVTVAINMRGTKHIFASHYLTMKSILNKFKKMLFFDELESALGALWEREIDYEKNPRIFTVVGKSLDWALKASENPGPAEFTCDLLITPNIPLHSRRELLAFSPYYELGREVALGYAPKILEIVAQKSKTLEKVTKV